MKNFKKFAQQTLRKKLENVPILKCLMKDGGIETDLTVVCLKEDYYRIITAAANREHDKFHIKKYLTKNIKISRCY